MATINKGIKKNITSIIFTLFVLCSTTTIYAIEMHKYNYNSGLYIGSGMSILSDDVNRINKTSKFGLNYVSMGFDFSPALSVNANYSKHVYDYALEEIDATQGQLTSISINTKIYFSSLNTVVTERTKSYLILIYGQGKMTSEIFDGETLDRKIYGAGIGFSFPLGIKSLRLNGEMSYVIDKTTDNNKLKDSLDKVNAYLQNKGFTTVTNFTTNNYDEFSDFYLRFYVDYFLYLGGQKPKAINEYLEENQKAIYKNPRVILKSKKLTNE